MIEIIVALIAVFIGGGIGYVVAKKINDVNFNIFLEQAKAKAKAIEYEAELVLKDAKNSIAEAEFSAKKKFDEKIQKLQREHSIKMEELNKKEQNLSHQEKLNEESKSSLLREKQNIKTSYLI